jgi:hypothetical protein
MKLWGIEIDTRRMPKMAWIIISIGILIVCVGMAGSFILRGSVTVSYAQAVKAAMMEQAYEEDLVEPPPMEVDK